MDNEICYTCLFVIRKLSIQEISLKHEVHYEARSDKAKRVHMNLYIFTYILRTFTYELILLFFLIAINLR